MSNLPVETTEPDPAATSISNDETVNKSGGDPSAPTNTDSVMTDAEAEAEKSNGAEEIKKDEKNVDTEKNGEATKIGDTKKESSEKHNSRQHGGDRRPWVKHENRSKYDPSVLPSSDDPKEIRAQVGNIKIFKRRSSLTII
jgi:lupus La protein